MRPEDIITQDDNENINKEEETNSEKKNEEAIHSAYKVPDKSESRISYHLSGMYQHWFLDYASYVILERAVPHINDGLKPVQRRILHSMKRLDDGRYNKVANIVGHTMQFHPHGDASIGDALVQLGQKDLLIDCQGNWGNILTGDSAAAPRYIEARLSKFALETVFNPKTTVWQLSYDGRNREPVTLPVKFPLLLAQGVEGIAVGLSSKILPHNFNELLDASVAYLKGENFALYPDFQTGGYIDVSKYNDGERGGSVKVRAKITKQDNKTLVISEIPYGKTTSTLIDSILKANDKGKIKIKKVDDNTARNVEILVHLAPGVSSDKTIDALYAFTDCEVSISPNCCVIMDNKPHFMTVSEVLKHAADETLRLLRMELEIQKGELEEQLFFASLEKIFIEERIYKDKEFEEAKDMDEAIAHIDKRLEPFKPHFIRSVTRDDILKLMEIKMGRILKFNADKCNALIAQYKEEIAQIVDHLTHIVDYTIQWFLMLKEKYGKQYPRLTKIQNFAERLQTERQPDDLQRGLPGRESRIQLHQTLCRDRRDARQRIHRDQRDRRLAHPLFQRQLERRGRNGEDYPKAQAPAETTGFRKRLQHDSHQRTQLDGKHPDEGRHPQSDLEAERQFDIRRTHGLVRPRRAAAELRRARRRIRRIPKQRPDYGDSSKRRLLHDEF